MNSSILQVYSSKSKCLGTGFVIDRDENGIFLATCGHVVNSCKKNIMVSEREAKVIINTYDSGLDLAVLYIEGLDNKPLDLSVNSTPSIVKVIGFSEFKGNPKREPVNNIPVKYDIQITKPKNINIFKLYPDESISSGYSGSPVICELTNKVIGIVNIQSGQNNNYGIRIEHLLDIHNIQVKNSSVILSNNKIKLTTKIDKLQFQLIHNEFEKDLKRTLQSFSTQPIIWVDPVIHVDEEDRTLSKDQNSRVELKTLIQKPKSIIIRSRQQFGLSSLARYLVNEAWENDDPSLWLYIDAENLKPHRNSIDKSISTLLNNLKLQFSDIECVILDEFSISIKDADKILNFINEIFKDKHLIIMLTTTENPLMDSSVDLPECRDFEVLNLWALPRNDVRKVVSKYNDMNYIGDENDVVNKVISDLEVLNIPRTPLNCLTLLKISEVEFDDSPVNRTEMIKRVLFLLFNIDEMPKYISRPDLKDTEYILGYFCEKMLMEKKYIFTRDSFLYILNGYCKDMEIDLDINVIFDVLNSNNILIQRENDFSFRFSYWVFYFAAQRMHQNKDFGTFVLSEMRYAQYPELIEFYTGIDRRRNDALNVLSNDLETVRNIVSKKCGLPIDFNIYDKAQWIPSEKSIEQMHSEVSEGVLSSNLPESVKDEYADSNYDRTRPLNQNINKILEDYSLLRLMKGVEASSKALRNSDYSDPAVRHKLLRQILLSWEQIVKVLLVLAPILTLKGRVNLEGVTFVLGHNIPKEVTNMEAIDNVIQLLPSSVIAWYMDHIYSKKMGTLLYKHLSDDNNKLVKHELYLLIVSKRPKGWSNKIENYIISEHKNSFYLYDIYRALRDEYQYSFTTRSTLQSIEVLIKMSAAKHKKGMKKPNKSIIKKVSDDILPTREFTPL